MGRTVVVIDDERDILAVICEVLEEEGFHVLCLDHPQQARALEGALTPSLFLIDLMLPGVDGIRLAQELRSRAFHAVPMIAMSASTSMVRAAQASRLFQHTISKPFDVTQLVKAVERHMH